MTHKQNTKTVNTKQILKNKQPHGNTSKNLRPVFHRRNTHIHDDVLSLGDGRSVS